MKYVLDASIALKWVLVEADTDRALQLRDDFRNGVHQLVAPNVFPIEIAHALTRAERKKIILVGEAENHLATVLNSQPALHPSLALLPRAVEMSSHEQLGVYDCLYVALAIVQRCQLVTADQRLPNAFPGLAILLPQL